MKRIFKIILFLFGALILLVIGLAIFFTIVAYNPDFKENLSNLSPSTSAASKDTLDIVTWNIGYAGLDKYADFILDGGEMSLARDKKAVKENLREIIRHLKNFPVDVYFLQEVDVDSKRSYQINQLTRISSAFEDYNAWFAPNYKALFVPSPPGEPIGKVYSGLLTLSLWPSESAYRYQLPGQYSWPTSIFHLNRCISTIKLSYSQNQNWHFVNLHLSAYDAEGNLRKQQLAFIRNFMLQRYEEGDYVVLGGDWNTLFEGVGRDDFGTYTTPEEDLFWLQDLPENWTPPKWQWVYDEKVPTVRTLEKPYVEGENLVTIIDGFLVSPNVEVLDWKGFDLGFKNSDHNPLGMRITAK